MPIPDQFDDFSNSLTGPICGGFDVTPDDSVNLPMMTRALMVTGAGDVAVVLKIGDAITLPGLAPGVIYPVRVVRVLVTNTTATGLKGLF